MKVLLVAMLFYESFVLLLYVFLLESFLCLRQMLWPCAQHPDLIIENLDVICK